MSITTGSGWLARWNVVNFGYSPSIFPQVEACQKMHFSQKCFLFSFFFFTFFFFFLNEICVLLMGCAHCSVRKLSKCLVLHTSPRGLTFMWWGCYGLCHRHKPTELTHSFLFCSCVYLCLYGPFNCISFHAVSRQLSVFLLCSSGRISAVLVLSTTYLSMKISFSRDIIPSG